MSESNPIDELRYGAALFITLLGFVVIAVLAYFLPVKEWQAAEVTALVGSLTTVLGTIVGAFLGVQAGAAGKQKAEDLANKALGALAPAEADKVLNRRS